jgi:hypothetical protein
VSRARCAVLLCCAIPLAACGAEADGPAAAKEQGKTLLARSGSSLVAIDTGNGKELRKLQLGAHDLQWRAIYSAAFDEAGGATTVTATDPATGEKLRSTEVPGRWDIPVAAGETPEGAVSGDGRQLVLSGPGGAGVSEFALIGTALDAPPQRFTLEGHFEFDALAPDGSAIYLSQIEGSGRYIVRAFDVASGKLPEKVVVEKTSLGTIMQGVPVARAIDPSGSPVHTLYRGGPVGAFVHSLDTAHGTAICILIPRSREAGEKWRLRLDNPASLHALNADLGTHYVIDPRIGDVLEAPTGAPAPGNELTQPDATYTLSPAGAVAVDGRTIGEVGADAELLDVR